jgi:hypothetical protein
MLTGKLDKGSLMILSYESISLAHAHTVWYHSVVMISISSPAVMNQSAWHMHTQYGITLW